MIITYPLLNAGNTNDCRVHIITFINATLVAPSMQYNTLVLYCPVNGKCVYSVRTQRYRKSFVPNSIHVTNNR